MDTSFIELIELLKNMLLEDNTLPNRNYEANKILCIVDSDYIKIHSCHNDCILYKKKYENMKKFPRCGESHYKMKDNGVEDNDGVTIKGVPTKVMLYLPIIQIFKKLFANVNTQRMVDVMQMK